MGAQNRRAKGPWGALCPRRHRAAAASEDPVRLRDVRGSDRTHGPIMTQGAGRTWVGEEAGKLSWTPTP